MKNTKKDQKKKTSKKKQKYGKTISQSKKAKKRGLQGYLLPEMAPKKRFFQRSVTNNRAAIEVKNERKQQTLDPRSRTLPHKRLTYEKNWKCLDVLEHFDQPVHA